MTDEYGTVGVVQEVVADTTQDGAPNLALTASAGHDQVGLDLFGFLDDLLARLSFLAQHHLAFNLSATNNTDKYQVAGKQL